MTSLQIFLYHRSFFNFNFFPFHFKYFFWKAADFFFTRAHLIEIKFIKSCDKPVIFFLELQKLS